MTVNVRDAKTHLSNLLRRVARGEELIITRAGRPMARLVPIVERGIVRQEGRDRGLFTVPEGFDDPLTDEEITTVYRMAPNAGSMPSNDAPRIARPATKRYVADPLDPLISTDPVTGLDRERDESW